MNERFNFLFATQPIPQSHCVAVEALEGSHVALHELLKLLYLVNHATLRPEKVQIWT